MEALQSTFGDAFTTLPLLIMGFIFFLGTLTSNIGLLYLFVGHLIIVPALSYLGNNDGHPFLDSNNQLNPTMLVKWLFSLAVFFGINMGSLAFTAGVNSWFFLLLLFVVGAQWYNRTSFFDVLNIMKFFPLGIDTSVKVTPAPTCNIVPTGPDEPIYSSPSHWVNHITFFFGFIMSNTVAVYNEPTPPKANTGDKDADDTRNAAIDSRVKNRKSLALSIAFVSTLVFLFLLMFRYRVGCESHFALALIPIGFAYMTGYFFFSLIYKGCGVRPADVLGIVQGMISSDLIDNPIVCVGTPN
jgi:hypothetical protein